VVAILVTIFLVVRYKKKKKKEKEAEVSYQQTAELTPPATTPKMRVVPKEDQPRETAPEPKLSVEEVVPERKPEPKPAGVPGTLGVPGNGAGAGTQGGKKPFKSSLPPEMMINANDPNAGL
jgi:hypothetical protein